MEPTFPGHRDLIGNAAASEDRLWTPWRMPYVLDGVQEAGCIFCNRLAGNQDIDSLILHRGVHAFIIMNLYPYNTGHVMIVPNAHIASLEDADQETQTELALLRAPLMSALRRAVSPDGFNLGLNVGAVAGAGVAAHLHEHVVPRWLGDANFMPVVAKTMVIPELAPVTYAKIRGEFAREFGACDRPISIVTTRDGKKVLAGADGALPRSVVKLGEPLWKVLLRDVRNYGAEDPELAGWATDGLAGEGPIALMFHSAVPAAGAGHGGYTWQNIEMLRESPDSDLLQSTFQRYFGRPAFG